MSKCIYNPSNASTVKTLNDIQDKINAQKYRSDDDKARAFLNELNENFINAKDVADSFRIGSFLNYNGTPVFMFQKQTLKGVEEYNKRYDKNISFNKIEKNLSGQSNVEFDALWYNNRESQQLFINQFKRNMMEATIWNLHTNTWVNPEAPAMGYGQLMDCDQLNANILKLKADALERIINKCGSEKARHVFSDFYRRAFCSKDRTKRKDMQQFNTLISK